MSVLRTYYVRFTDLKCPFYGHTFSRDQTPRNRASANSGYLPRAASKALHELLRVLPVAVITGARQTGKSRLLVSDPAVADHLLVTLDDPIVHAEALKDIGAFVRRAPKMIIDEVQRIPEILIAVKAVVDAEYQQTRGRFVLTGSANLLMMKTVSESLAGRAGYLTLEPMSRRELLGRAETGNWSLFFDKAPSQWADALAADDAGPADWRETARRGGFPYPALHLEEQQRGTWFDGYVATYLERDLRDLTAIADLSDFRRAMQAFALRAGNPVNASAVAADLGLVARTLRRWLDILNVSYQLLQLPAYTVRQAARLRKRPKYYWNDAGLALHLSGSPRPSGVHLETLVYADMRAWAALQLHRPQVMYWRDEDNREVDFVIEQKFKVVAFEVKATEKPGADDWQHLKHFVKHYHDKCLGGVLLHGGDETFMIADNIVATPWWRVL